MERGIYDKFVNNIAILAHKTANKKIEWQKNSETSFYLEKEAQDGKNTIVSVQKIHKTNRSKGALNRSKGSLSGILNEAIIAGEPFNYVFQIMDKRTKNIIISFATEDLAGNENKSLKDNIRMLYKEADRSIDVRASDLFDSIMDNL